MRALIEIAKTMAKVFGALLLGVIVLGYVVKSGCSSMAEQRKAAQREQRAKDLSPNQPAPAPAKPRLDKSPEMQAQRLKLIEQQIGLGLYDAITQPAKFPIVPVRPAFYALTIDEKRSIVGLIYAYYFDGTGSYDAVRLVDYRTGNKVGDFTKELGLKMD